MSDAWNRNDLTTAFLAALNASTGWLVGDANVPSGIDEQGDEALYPYLTVFEIPGGHFWGSLADPAECVDYVYQIDSVGRTAVQSRVAAQRVRGLLLDRVTPFAVVLPGDCELREITPDMLSSGGQTREGVPPRELYTSSDRYVLRVVVA